MEQHHQVVSLHNIIKAQQAKVHELRHQLKIANEREENRYGQICQNNQAQLNEKEKMIHFLKEQLAKAQYGHKDEHYIGRIRRKENQDGLEHDLMQAKKKNIELEGKLRRMEKQSQTKVHELMDRASKGDEEIRKLNEAKAMLSMEMAQLNKFYKNSGFGIARRKETLLWVDKFTEYLESSDLEGKKTLHCVNELVINEINNLRASLGAMIVESVRNEENMHKNKDGAKQEINAILEKVRKQTQQIFEENSKYWINQLKQERNAQTTEQIKGLTQQLAACEENHEQEVAQLSKKLKEYESERKTLILGFQELRSLTDRTEKNHKKEVKCLKQTMEELIGSGQARDQEFEAELKVMSSQIEQISSRYYDNIDLPVRKLSQKMGTELEQVKQELENLEANSAFRCAMERIEELMGRYISKVEAGNRPISQISSYMSHSNEIISDTLTLIADAKLHQKGAGLNTGESVPEPAWDSNCLEIEESLGLKGLGRRRGTGEGPEGVDWEGVQSAEGLTEVKLMDLREKANKSNYQLVLSKKHLIKMQEHCGQLEKKLHLKQSERQMSARIVELEAENSALKEVHENLRQSHEEDVKSFKHQILTNSIEKQSLTNYKQLFTSAMTRIDHFNSLAQLYIREEKQHFLEMQENMKTIRGLLIRPTESFQMLVKEFMSMSRHGQSSASESLAKTGETIFMGLSTERKDNSHNSLCNYQTFNNQENEASGRKKRQGYSFLTKNIISKDSITQYKQILNAKVQNGSSIQKLLSELIKNLRDFHKEDANGQKKMGKGIEGIKAEEGEKRVNRGLDKKIREVQSLRIKDRQEMLARAHKLSEHLDKIEQKMQKNGTLKQALQKFESSFNGRIEEVLQKVQARLSHSQIRLLKEDVIADLRSKLGEANLESEGLRKQLTVALAVQKASNNPEKPSLQ